MKKSQLSRPRCALALAAAGCAAVTVLSIPGATAQPVATHHARAQSAASTLADPVVDGKPYYLVETVSNRGITFEQHGRWDYALLTNQAGSRGTPLVFHKQDDGTYTITSTSSNWGGYTTWCTSFEGVYLAKPGGCEVRGSDRFTLTPHSQGYMITRKTLGGAKEYATYPSPNRGGKGWLSMEPSVFPNFREYAYFKAIPAE
ncbi:hypothetical protein ACIQU6_16280 [Streptomyces sp. NPDC090442]|uniref:hypothetical protein n=1 Tax=Streptomyces sp. NPDC090442 TaxID=3365962 RepID=UPI0037FE9A7B